MKITSLLIFFCCFLAKVGFAESCDSVSIKKLYTDANSILSKDVNKSYKLAFDAFSQCKQCPYTKYYFESVIALSKVYYQKDQGDSVIKLLFPIISNLPQNTSIFYKACLNHKIGSAYIMTMQSELGLKHCLIALKNFELIKDTANSANILVNIANVYQQQNNFNQAEKYLRQAESKAKLISKQSTLGNVYNSMGILYAEHNQLDSAEKFFLKSTSIREKLNDKTSVVWNYNNLGGLYVMLGKNKEAVMFLEKALRKFEESENYDGQTSVANNLGKLYLQLGDSKKAYEYYSYSRKLYTLTNNLDNLENLYNNLSVYYDEMGDIKTAFKYSDSLIVLKDSLYGRRLDESIAEMQTKYDVEKKDLELAKNKAEITNEKNKRYITYGALVFFISLLIIALWAFKQKKKSAILLTTKNNQLENANHLITIQKEQLSEKQKEILDSIYYAKKIQNALLASEELLLKNLLDHFILFKPKDIVSGDFTWATTKDNLFYIACCDSTGHGVPGAFMSLLNIGFLSEAIKERNILDPGKIFDYVRARLIETIGNDHQKDGFDGILLCMDIHTKTITYTAANNNPVLVSKNELMYLNVDKMPVGDGIKKDLFNTYSINYKEGDILYLFTDGYPDQFGGEKGKKFKYKQLEELLLSNSNKPVKYQKDQLEEVFEKWKGNLEQVDDICVIGIRL